MTASPGPTGLAERLLAIAEQWNEGMPAGELLTAIVEAAMHFTGAQAGLVTQIDGDRQHVLAASSTMAEAVGRSAVLSGSMLERLIGSDVPTAEVRTADLQTPMAEVLERRGWLRLAACRAAARGRVTGGLYVFFADLEPPLSFDQLTVLRAMTGLANSVAATDRVREEGRLLVATMSHELRTPITVVKGFAETLQSRWPDLDDEARRTAVEVIRQRTTDLSQLLDRLMLGMHADGDMIEVHSAPYDLATALGQLTLGIPQLAPEHPLTVEVPADLPTVLGDRAMLEVVVGELLTNAAKYSARGKPIELSAGADRAWAWVQVSDRGVGIDPAHVEQVFARFWQSDRSDARRFGGVGLGLYLVRRLVEAQGGWATVRPRPGGGTVAEVRLPLADPP